MCVTFAHPFGIVVLEWFNESEGQFDSVKCFQKGEDLLGYLWECYFAEILFRWAKKQESEEIMELDDSQLWNLYPIEDRKTMEEKKKQI